MIVFYIIVAIITIFAIAAVLQILIPLFSLAAVYFVAALMVAFEYTYKGVRKLAKRIR